MSEYKVESEKTYQMLWDCGACGQRKNLGLTHRCCPNCGKAQDPNARYFPSEEEKVAVEDHPFVGADVTCPYCSTPNSKNAKCCTGCGAPLADAKEVARRGEQMVASGQAFAGDSSGQAKRELGVVGYGPGPAAAPPPSPPADKKGGAGKIGCIVAVVAALVLLIGGIVFMSCCKKTGSFEVTGHSWERSIEVERYGMVRQSKWCDEMPSGAKEISRTKEQRSSEKVEDGKECRKVRKDQGNGTFKEVEECKPKYKDKPVLADKCTYEAPDWKTERTLKESGTSNKDTPKWPVVSGLKPGSCVGCEREGKKNETYTVKFRNLKEGKEASCTTTMAKWQSIPVGRKYQADVNRMDVVDCDTLKQQ